MAPRPPTCRTCRRRSSPRRARASSAAAGGAAGPGQRVRPACRGHVRRSRAWRCRPRRASRWSPAAARSPSSWTASRSASAETAPPAGRRVHAPGAHHEQRRTPGPGAVQWHRRLCRRRHRVRHATQAGGHDTDALDQCHRPAGVRLPGVRLGQLAITWSRNSRENCPHHLVQRCGRAIRRRRRSTSAMTIPGSSVSPTAAPIRDADGTYRAFHGQRLLALRVQQPRDSRLNCCSSCRAVVR